MKFLDPKLFNYLKGGWSRVFSLALMAGVKTLLLLLQSFALAWIITGVFQKHYGERKLLLAELTFIACFLIRSLLNSAITIYSVKFGSRVRNQIQDQLITKAIDRGIAESSEVDFNNFVTLLTSGLTSLDGYFSSYLPSLLNALFSPAATLLTLLIVDWRSALYGFVTLPLAPLFGILIGRFTDQATKNRWERLFLLRNYFLDLISGIPTLQVFGRIKVQENKVAENSENFRKETMKVLRISFLSAFALELVASLSVALIALALGLRLVDGKISLLSALFILIIAPEIYWPLRQSAALFHASADGVSTLNQALELLTIPDDSAKDSSAPATISKKLKVISPGNIKELSWRNLEIERKPNILKIPDGRLISGEITYLATPSGSGKTSLTLALMGFLKSKGEIRIKSDEGVFALNDLDLQTRQSLFSWLPQSPRFPNETIMEHFRSTCPEATVSQIAQLGLRIGLDFEKLVNGFDTQLGVTQEPLSQGELRRIALIRALLHPAPILILDEPTASLDSETEQAAWEVIAAEKNRLILYISHRTSLTRPTFAEINELA